MNYRVTTNGGFILMKRGSLEAAQHIVLANRTIPVYVRSINIPTQVGWVMSINAAGETSFSWHGERVTSHALVEEYCPWMIQLHTAIVRAITPVTPIKQGAQP